MAEILDRIRDDHVNMSKLLDAFERQLELLERGEHPDWDILQGVLEYCLSYPDHYHHPAEDAVFLRLRGRDPAAAQEVGDLRGEHVALGELTRRLDRLVKAVLNEAEVPRDRIHESGRTFLETYRSHMQWEEDAFLPLAEERLSDSDLAALDAEAKGGCDPLFGDESEERFQSLRDHILAWDRDQA